MTEPNQSPSLCAPAIEFKDVSFSYQSNDQYPCALDHVSFRIAKGEMVAIMGANGSGKSTLAKLADALIAPSSGDVYVFGKKVSTEADVFDIRKQVGFVFQDPDNQFVATTVEDEVAFGPENLGIDPCDVSMRVEKCLSEVGMSKYRNRDVNTLSGGQKQRIAIAGALAMHPQVLILDEATSMLDGKAAADLIELITALHANGMTVIMITHSPNIAKHAQRLLVLREGKVAFDGSIREYENTIGWPRLPSRVELGDGREVKKRSNTYSKPATLLYENVSFIYEESRNSGPVFENITFDVLEGEIVAIMGRNGSGKSTLLKMSNGLLKPSCGRVLVNGTDISTKEASNKARFEVGLCFQYPEKQLFASSVFEDIAFGARNLGLSDDEVEFRVRKSLQEVQLDFDDVAYKSPFSLSGGQMRRVAIAGVLAMEPGVLVMDEPCAGLDMDAHADLMYMLAKLRHSGMTILMATHDVEETRSLADRIVYLQNDIDIS